MKSIESIGKFLLIAGVIFIMAGASFLQKIGVRAIGMDEMRGGDHDDYHSPERSKEEAFNPLALVYLYLIYPISFI